MLTDSDFLQEYITLPITEQALEYARNFAALQLESEQSKRVFKNTLTVFIVKKYFDILGIASNLVQCESWHPLFQMSGDFADLEIVGKGKLECRPIDNQDNCLRVPFDSQTGRIGYLAVQIDEEEKVLHLLGFTDSLDGEEIAVDKLDPIENFIPYILQASPIVRLDEWLNDKFDVSWQSTEKILYNVAPNSARYSDHRIVSRVKKLKWSKTSELPTILLLVMLSSEEEEVYKIRIQLHSHMTTPSKPLPQGSVKSDYRFISSTKQHLPANMQLSLLSEDNEVLQTVTTRTNPPDDWIQLNQIRCNAFEKFSIEIKLLGEVITQEFII
ncbi:protein of unknown function DUF1822 [[Leptolyngbya] sp. PCC 7376]|uniref:DUF1822 family protein n=1 Tax=[Leptolyngbya] sp. PCC 7376 TaxID=111781 RepID=UPI00029F29E8|nr:DUF1822 family protein [[Leptolyngbya] sp. PCC 7376]AFY39974.1 protein of unknown function DUF1822 [[Leptolyngbya] sp. PCC 7376]